MAKKRFANQNSEEFLKNNCTYIISNDGASEALAAKVLDVTVKITKGLEK
jgi:hypothetical protein